MIVEAHREGTVPSASKTVPSSPELTQEENTPMTFNENTTAPLGVTEAQQARLREPFPPEAIGKLPRGGVKLDYVGHAAVTDRLLEVDRHWSWEPLAYDTNGAPLVTERNGMLEMWIRLTIGGTTRVGVGTTQKSKPEAAKELISDALRNAAMRFGVALDLWSKEDLQAFNEAAEAPAPKAAPKPQPKVEGPSETLKERLKADLPDVDEGPFALMEALVDLEALMVSEGFWPEGALAKTAKTKGTTLDDLAEAPTELHEFVVSAYEGARKKVGL